MSDEGETSCCCGGKGVFYIAGPKPSGQVKNTADPADPHLVRYKIQSDPPIIQQQPKLMKPDFPKGSDDVVGHKN